MYHIRHFVLYLYFVKLLGSDITQLYDLLMLRYVNYQTVNKTDSFSFRDMHVIYDILYDSKHHHRWQMTFDVGVIYKKIIDFSRNSGCIWKIMSSLNSLYLKTYI